MLSSMGAQTETRRGYVGRLIFYAWFIDFTVI